MSNGVKVGFHCMVAGGASFSACPLNHLRKYGIPGVMPW